MIYPNFIGKGLTIETVLSTGYFTLKEWNDKGLTMETVLSTGYFTLKEWNDKMGMAHFQSEDQK